MAQIGRCTLNKWLLLLGLLFVVVFSFLPQQVNAAENDDDVEIEIDTPKAGQRFTTDGRNQTLVISGSTRAESGVEVTVKYSIISELCGKILDLPCEKVKIDSKEIHTYVSDGTAHPFNETLILSNVTLPDGWIPVGDYSLHVWCEVEGTKVAEATREIRIVEPNSAAYLDRVDIQPSSSLVMMDPTFYADDLDYTVKISGANSITFTPYLMYLTATMKVNGVSVENGEGVPIPLQPNVPVTIAVEVTAENESNQLTYTFTFERVTSNNAYLQNLVLSDGSLTFDKNTFSYTVNVPYSVDRLTVTPTAEHETSSVKVNGVSVASGQASDWISLNQEYNEIKVEVTAEDGTTTKTYTITVRRQSNNADLKDLRLSGVNLPFDKDTLHYTVNVPYSVSSVTVTPTADDPLASVEVNGQLVTISNPAVEINLNVGANLISITVTAEDGTTKTYTITVRRQSNNADLQNLVLSGGSLTFDKDILSYTVVVPNSVSSVTVTPTADDPMASVEVNGQLVTISNPAVEVNLNGRDSEITVTVTAEDGTTKTYTITVRRQSGNADLSDLSLSSGTLVPTFDKNTFNYKVNVPYSVSSVTVTPTAADALASVEVNGQPVTSGKSSVPISLKVGSNTVTVTVTAEDGTTKTYTLTVKRADNDTSAPGGGGDDDGGRDDENLSLVNQWSFLLKEGTIQCCNNELILFFPPGATEQTLRITITQVANTGSLSAALDEGQAIVSRVFEIVKDKPGIFQKPVKLSLRFAPSKVGTEQIVSIFFYDEGKQKWMNLGGTAEGEWVTTEVDHFTKFAVIASDAEADRAASQATTPAFDDIAGHWGEAYNLDAAEKKLVNGYPDGTFRPN